MSDDLNTATGRLQGLLTQLDKLLCSIHDWAEGADSFAGSMIVSLINDTWPDLQAEAAEVAAGLAAPPLAADGGTIPDATCPKCGWYLEGSDGAYIQGHAADRFRQAAGRAATTEDYYAKVPVHGSPERPAYTLSMAQLEESRDQWKARAEELGAELDTLRAGRAASASPATERQQRAEAARYLRDLAQRLLDDPTNHYKEAYEALLAEADEEDGERTVAAAPAPERDK